MSRDAFNVKTSPKMSCYSSPSPTSDSETLSKKARTRYTSPEDMATRRETQVGQSGTERKSLVNLLKGEGSLASADHRQQSKICAITNSTGEDVAFTHIIPKDASAELLDDLEFAWGMQPGTLDINDPGNLLPLTRSLKESFDGGQWALLPIDTDLVLSLAHYAHGLDCDGIKTVFDIYKIHSKAAFSYQFIPLLGSGSPIVRLEDVASTSGSQAVTYKHPYGKFPQITLPIYPHFAIIDLRIKAARLTKRQAIDLDHWFIDNKYEIYPEFYHTKDIYKRWLPTKKFDHEYSHLPPLDRALNRLINPDDSYSCATTVSVDIDSEAKSDAELNPDSDSIHPRDFCESHAKFIFRILLWRSRVSDALAEGSDKFGPPMTVPVDSPERHPSPPATSSEKSDNGSGASSSS